VAYLEVIVNQGTWWALVANNYSKKHSKCAKHTLNAKHESSRGVWGHAPPEKFLEKGAVRLNLVISERPNIHLNSAFFHS